MPRRDKTQGDSAAIEATGTITIEADSVEEAMQRLATEVGASAEILDARKVHRGGLGGFFARERVQLTVRAAAETRDDGLAGVLDRMTRDTEAQEAEFATMLRKELGQERRDLGLDTFLEAVGWDRSTSVSEAEKTHAAVGDIAAAMTRPAPDAPETTPSLRTDATPIITTDQSNENEAPAITEPFIAPVVVQRSITTPGQLPILPFVPASTQRVEEPDDSWRMTTPDSEPAGAGPIAWSTIDLVRHGIPSEIVSAVAGVDPNDDMAWITALAVAVAPYCEPFAGGDTVLIGSPVRDLAALLDIMVIEPGQGAPYEGPVAAMISPHGEDREWFDFVRGTRQIHYVIGDDARWRNDLVTMPAVVSWTTETALVDALYLAVATGAKLGYGALPGSDGRVARAYPVDIALALRSMMRRN